MFFLIFFPIIVALVFSVIALRHGVKQKDASIVFESTPIVGFIVWAVIVFMEFIMLCLYGFAKWLGF